MSFHRLPIREVKSVLSGVCLAVLLAADLLAQQSVIKLIGFGDGSLTVDPNATTAGYTQTTSGLVFNGTYALGDTVGGGFAAQDWSLYAAPTYTIGVLMTVAGADPSLPFSVELFDQNLTIINRYSGVTTGATTSTFVPLTMAMPGTRTFAAVAGAQFTWDGGGTANVVLEGLAVAVPNAPMITSTKTAQAVVNSPFSYFITANNSPISYAAVGLPPGLSVNPSTGLISGAPGRAGNFPVTISASNKDAVAASASLTLTVAKGAQTITFRPAATQKFQKGRRFTLSATATSKSPVSFRSSNSRILSISGRIATIRGKGKVTVTASQGGNANYLPARAVSRPITIR